MTKTILWSALVAGIVAAAMALALRVEPVNQPVGAVSSPDIMSQYLTVGGQRHWYYNVPLTTATTTVCSVQSPAATSTIRFAGITMSVSSTTASKVYIAKGAKSNATTTLFVGVDVAANAKATIVATSTSLQTSENWVIAPSNYVNFGMSGGTGTFSPTGSCHVEFEEFN